MGKSSSPKSPLSPTPSYYASTIDPYSSLFLRVNDSGSMENLLKNLSCVLDLTILNFHKEKNGLYEFKYPHECGLKVFPLSYEQERKLLEIGVQSFNCETYEFHLAFERTQDPRSATDHDETTNHDALSAISPQSYEDTSKPEPPIPDDDINMSECISKTSTYNRYL